MRVWLRLAECGCVPKIVTWNNTTEMHSPDSWETSEPSQELEHQPKESQTMLAMEQPNQKHI